MDAGRTIFVTKRDLQRLTRLLEGHRSRRDAKARAALEEELGHAIVVDSREVPRDVVTMNSRVQFEDAETGAALDITLVYRRDADVDEGRISVLAPVGSALVGLAVGQSITWQLPAGKDRHLRVIGVTYQTEAAGDLES
jgi:regulator of nucleoside diphosphate kinase